MAVAERRRAPLVEAIACPECGARADRVGAQDSCDVYVCTLLGPDSKEPRHLTRIMVDLPRIPYAIQTVGLMKG